MFGVLLRLLAAGEASRRLGDYMKLLTARYLVLSVAGIVFLVAMAFGILAGFWALNLMTQNPIWSALIMMGILLLAGFSIALTAYGITREKPQSASLARPAAVQAVSHIPTVEDVGREIESAVRRYGPARVTAAAVAGGLIAGLLAKRFTQPRVVYRTAPPPGNGGRYANGRRYA